MQKYTFQRNCLSVTSTGNLDSFLNQILTSFFYGNAPHSKPFWRHYSPSFARTILGVIGWRLMHYTFSQSLGQNVSPQPHKVVTQFKMATIYYKMKHRLLSLVVNLLLYLTLYPIALFLPNFASKFAAPLSPKGCWEFWHFRLVFKINEFKLDFSNKNHYFLDANCAR